MKAKGGEFFRSVGVNTSIIYIRPKPKMIQFVVRFLTLQDIIKYIALKSRSKNFFFERQFFAFKVGKHYITMKVEKLTLLWQARFFFMWSFQYFKLHQAFFTFLWKSWKNKSAWWIYPLVKLYIDEFLATQSDWDDRIYFFGFLRSIWTNPAEKNMLLIVYWSFRFVIMNIEDSKSMTFISFQGLLLYV